ncbi:hypothetical protein BP6252_13795 [Coleophoma cylindrospora]|uniref:HNH nuclease domain-containing protein n=1 Tax=Coleophoma cylindrospora TaxID=1849047 RepID=A0A3D8Q6Y8_9HELO|nr:hypothetical protein BP6252_13795 [Coleophoma cylindrospora]
MSDASASLTITTTTSRMQGEQTPQSSAALLQIRPEAQDPTTFLPTSIVQPAISTNPHHQIRFRHPHYPHSSSVLLTLFAPDCPNGGIEYGVAHAACGIITGNRWDGWFSVTVDGDAIELQHGDILSHRDYYFHVPNSTLENPYPIVPTFKEWSFPHDNLHPLWQREECVPVAQSRFAAPSSLSNAVLYRDQSCRISGFSEGTQAAHLCPRNEETWFQRNEMSRYNLNPLLIATMPLEDTSNALLLRQDLHSHFDAHKFVFVPKKTSEETPLVTHLLIPSRELGLLYHNVRLKPIPDVDIAFLFTRFAWSIFTLVAGFLRNGVQRAVIGTTISVDGAPRIFNAADCSALVSPKSRSRSPAKRARKTDALEDETEMGMGIEEGVEEYASEGKSCNVSKDCTYLVLKPRGRSAQDRRRETACGPEFKQRDGIKKEYWSESNSSDTTRNQPSVRVGHNAEKKRRRTSSNVSDIEVEDSLAVGLEGMEDSGNKRRKTTSDLSEVQTPIEESLSDNGKHPKRLGTVSSNGLEVETPVNDLETLRQTWLLKERKRSDLQMRWEQEEEWARGIRDGGVMGPEDVRRWWEYLGCDVEDETV